MKKRKLRAERLRELREAKGWTGSDLARRLGTEVSTPPAWERGQKQPRPIFIERLAEIFEVEVEDLIDQSDTAEWLFKRNRGDLSLLTVTTLNENVYRVSGP
jgi:transcriptional regulator with XRE-family HTH domain